MVSRKDVADRAGVSVAVVSYVLNNRSIVKEETRQKVLEAVRELGYQPNQLARGLKTKQSKQIAVLVNYLGNPFEAGLLLHIEVYLRARGYFVFFQTFIAAEEDELKSLFMGRVDGIILLGQALKEETLQHFHALQIPVVSLTKPLLSGTKVPYIDVDWLHAMRQLVAHVKEEGHLRIGFMGGGQTISHFATRLQAFLEAMKLEGLVVHPEDLLDGGGRFEHAERELLALSQDRPLPFTALISANDLMAAGCLSACRTLGLHVPGQLAIAGCEDVLMSSQTNPPLTVLQYPRREAAEAVSTLLLELLEKKSATAAAQNAHLVIRQSTKL